MIVYIDVVILENLIINFFLLLITIQVMHIKVKYRSIFLSSILGALYILCLFIPQLNIVTNIIGKCIFAFIMVFIVLRDKGLITIFKGFIIFLMISFMFAGICFMFALLENNYEIDSAFTITNYSTKYLLFGGMIIYITVERIRTFLKDRAVVTNFIYELEINIDDSINKITAFLDTGNELKEPITNLPVIIVDKSSFRDISVNHKECFNVPYKVINGKTGNMRGIKVKEVKLFKDNNYIFSREAIICFSEGKLSITGDYEALLSRGII